MFGDDHLDDFKMLDEQITRKIRRLVWAGWTLALIKLAALGALVYVAVHFIKKWW